MNRKIYEINELYNTNNNDLINLALKINESEKIARENCDEEDKKDYNIYNDLEKYALKLENKNTKDYKKFVKGIEKTLKLNSYFCNEPIQEKYEIYKLENNIK